MLHLGTTPLAVAPHVISANLFCAALFPPSDQLPTHLPSRQMGNITSFITLILYWLFRQCSKLCYGTRYPNSRPESPLFIIHLMLRCIITSRKSSYLGFMRICIIPMHFGAQIAIGPRRPTCRTTLSPGFGLPYRYRKS